MEPTARLDPEGCARESALLLHGRLGPVHPPCILSSYTSEEGTQCHLVHVPDKTTQQKRQLPKAPTFTVNWKVEVL